MKGGTKLGSSHAQVLTSTAALSRSAWSSIAPSPIGPPQSWATSVTSRQVELVDQPARVLDVRLERVAGQVGRLVGAAEAHVVEGDAAAALL